MKYIPNRVTNSLESNPHDAEVAGASGRSALGDRSSNFVISATAKASLLSLLPVSSG